MPNTIPTQTESSKNKYRLLEERTTNFAKNVIRLCRKLPPDNINRPIIDQLIRASGSVGANYREANEAISKKDFPYRVRISRKEAKESQHWLSCTEEANPAFATEISPLLQEAGELRNIFTAILGKFSAS